MAKSKELTPGKAPQPGRADAAASAASSLFLFLVSGMINVLALTGSFYMMQIYDRALTSGSIPTLLVLSALAIGLYLFQGVLRHRPLAGAGAGRRPARQEARAAGAPGRDRHAALRLLDRRSAGARPRRRHGARLPRQPGPVGAVRPAVDADLSWSSSTCCIRCWAR